MNNHLFCDASQIYFKILILFEHSTTINMKHTNMKLKILYVLYKNPKHVDFKNLKIL